MNVTEPVRVSCADYIRCRPDKLRTALADPSVWRSCWPDLTVTLVEERTTGWRWHVSGIDRGTAEWYLEARPWPDGAGDGDAVDFDAADGVIVHWFLRVAPRTGRSRRRSTRQQVRRMNRIATQYRRRIWELKDSYEHAYPPQAPDR